VSALAMQIRLGLLEGESAFSTVSCDPRSTRGCYYGQKEEPALSAVLAGRAGASLSLDVFWIRQGFCHHPRVTT